MSLTPLPPSPPGKCTSGTCFVSLPAWNGPLTAELKFREDTVSIFYHLFGIYICGKKYYFEMLLIALRRVHTRKSIFYNINSFSRLFCIVNFPSYLRTVNIKDLVYMHSNINFINISILVT